MKLLSGIIVLAACMPYMACDNDAVAAAAESGGGDRVTSAAAAAATSSYRPDYGPDYCFIPYECPKTIIPVCGTNGKTYRNVCVLNYYSRKNKELHLSEMSVKKSGACVNESCYCSPKKDELCAIDENTYLNDCVFECQNRRRCQLGQSQLTIRHPGKCIDCPCTQEYAPVCANNDVTFSNACQFRCENARRDAAGQRLLAGRWQGRCDCGCSQFPQPVCAACGYYQRTFRNHCALGCYNRKRVLDRLSVLVAKHDGPCYPCNCFVKCADIYQPVCGSDRMTYWNECWLNCNIKCRADYKQPELWKGYGGRCAVW